MVDLRVSPTGSGEDPGTSERGPLIDPLVLGPYLAIHVACVGAFWTGVSTAALSICFATYFARVFACGIAYHRYFAHRAFKTSRTMQCALALAGAFVLEGGPLWWAATHRHHHRHADTPGDLHSPRYSGLLYAHSGWFADRRYRRTNLAGVPDLARYPELVWIDRWHPVFMIIWFGSMYAFWGALGVVWGGCISSVLVWHTTHCIQSVSHAAGGYRLFPSPDESRNHLAIGLLTLGEWHNNHHYFPGSARQGFAWWEIDIVFLALRLLNRVGLVWDLRAPSQDLVVASLVSERATAG